MENKKTSSINIILLCLCNLNGVGLGYLLAGLKKRWLVVFGSNLALGLGAYFVGIYKTPVLWAVIFIMVYIGMVLDLWFILKKNPGLMPAFAAQKPHLLPIITVLITLLFFGGSILYQSAGNRAIESSRLAYMDGDIDAAYEQISKAGKVYRLSFNPDFMDVQKALDEIGLAKTCFEQAAKGQYEAVIESAGQFREQYTESAYLSSIDSTAVDAILAWSQEQQQAGNYKDSMDNLIAVRTDFTDQYSQRKIEINQAIAEGYSHWGQTLMDKGDYDQAIAKFEEAATVDVDSATTEHVYQSAARAYLASAIASAAADDYETASNQIEYLQTHYATSDVYEEAISKMPEMYLDWGNYLRDQSSFLSAMEKYELASQLTEDEEDLIVIEAESQKNIALLANDSGHDGQAIMIETLNHFCNLGWMDEYEINPAIDYFTEQPGKALSCENSPYLPGDLVADTPGTFRYMVRFITNKDLEGFDFPLETCTYEGGYSLERWDKWMNITVDKPNPDGFGYANEIFMGSDPAPCPQQRHFTSATEKLYGGDVDMAEVEAWLREIIK